ncbi:unnamed protein product [Cylindrotheca closterium]|uniref:Uncharacterized protein n=1 Tax=Cylindrotheca closterium TaxID=2856 RepID=A0AAD2CGC9_9STRA|nr:unnamed protein product [Cylindrotheca closterium]
MWEHRNTVQYSDNNVQLCECHRAVNKGVHSKFDMGPDDLPKDIRQMLRHAVNTFFVNHWWTKNGFTSSGAQGLLTLSESSTPQSTDNLRRVRWTQTFCPWDLKSCGPTLPCSSRSCPHLEYDLSNF